MSTLSNRANAIRQERPKYRAKKKVMVRCIEKNPFRVSDEPVFSNINLPTVFTVQNINDGRPMRYRLYDKDQNPSQQFPINREMIFDTGNDVDVCNLYTIELLMAQYPDYSKKLSIIDEQGESEDKIEREERVVNCKAALIRRKSDKEFLAMLYRRLKGITIGISPDVILSSLLSIASESPELIEEIIANEKSPKNAIASLIDIGIEKGIILKDGSYYKLGDGTIIGENFDKTIYRLESDLALKADIEYMVNNGVAKKKVELQSKIKIEDPSLIRLADIMGEEVETIPLNPDGSEDTEGLLELSEEKLDRIFKAAKEHGFIEQQGDKNGARYLIPSIMTEGIKKGEMLAYFKNNPKELERLDDSLKALNVRY